MVAQDRLPRLLCRDCRDIEAAFSEADNAAMFSDDIARHVGLWRSIRARDGGMVWFAVHDKPLKRLDGPHSWRSRRAIQYMPRNVDILAQDKAPHLWQAGGYSVRI